MLCFQNILENLKRLANGQRFYFMCAIAIRTGLRLLTLYCAIRAIADFTSPKWTDKEFFKNLRSFSLIFTAWLRLSISSPATAPALGLAQYPTSFLKLTVSLNYLLSPDIFSFH